MFKGLVQRFRDMKALSSLMQTAETYSRKRNEGDKPSAEHFVLAAIDSPDGAARSVFEKLGLDASDFEDALREQYKQSLNSIGIDVDDASLRGTDDAENANRRPYAVTESGRELLHHMAQLKSGAAFSGANVLRAIASVPPGPAHRAFIGMGTTAEQIAKKAEEWN